MTKIQVRLNPDVPPTGSDLSIVNAARRSFNTRSEWDTEPRASKVIDGKMYFSDFPTPNTLKEKDKRLLEFLARGMTADDFETLVHSYSDTDLSKHPELLWQWRNTPTHDTPFNHTFISFEVKAPIFVRAQLVKHEYLIMSEFSRRYITDDIEFYTPDGWRGRSADKKQGSEGSWEPNHQMLDDTMSRLADLYDQMIHDGCAPEQARMVLPQSTMTEWTWSGTLGAFAKMCTLRLHPEAQYEARLVAQEVYQHLKEQWPVGAKALVEGV